MDPVLPILAAALLVVWSVGGLVWGWDWLSDAWQAIRDALERVIYRRSIARVAVERAELEARREAEAALDALTVSDVVLLQALGWEAPADIQRRTERALDRVRLDATRVPRPPRPPMSEAQRALAAEADRRISWGGTPSQRQQILANEADARIARGEVHPGSEVVDTRTFGGYGLHAEAERKVAAAREEAQRDQKDLQDELRRYRALVREQQARVKLEQALGRFGATLRTETIESADGWFRTYVVPDHGHDPRCHCGAC